MKIISLKTQALAVLLAATAMPLFAQTDTVDDRRTIREVVVTGTREAVDTRHLPMTVTVVERDALTEQARQNVLPTLMEQVPGLTLTSRGMMGYGVSTGASGGLSLRGLSSGNGQMLVLIDGHPQYNGIFGHAISDSYQTLMAERVEVLRGPASLLYGSNAMGGVINIVTRQMTEDGVRLSGNFGFGTYGTVQDDLSVQAKRGRLTATAALQYGQSDNQRDNMGFEQYGGFVKVGYEFSRHWNLYADLDLTHFNASNPGTVQQPKIDNDQRITRGATSIALSNDYGWVSGRLTVYDNFGKHKIDDGYNVGGTPQTDLFRSRDRVAGISEYETFRLWPGSHATVGFDYQNIYGHAWYIDRLTGETITTGKRKMQSADERAQEIAEYVNLRQDLWQWLTLDAGVRYDYHSVAGAELVPQFGAALRPIADGTLKLTVGKGFRNPTMKEMYMYGTANHDSLHAERLWNYELSWQHQLLEGRLAYGVNLFVMQGDNLIQTVAGMNINSGEFDNRGIEMDASWRINSHWHIATNHSYLHMKEPIVAMPTYKGYFGLESHYGRWHLTLGLQHLNELYTNVAAEEKESFTLLNAMVSYEAAPGIRLWLKGDNLLNEEYEYNAGYPMPGATAMLGLSLGL